MTIATTTAAANSQQSRPSIIHCVKIALNALAIINLGQSSPQFIYSYHCSRDNLMDVAKLAVFFIEIGNWELGSKWRHRAWGRQCVGKFPPPTSNLGLTIKPQTA